MKTLRFFSFQSGLLKVLDWTILVECGQLPIEVGKFVFDPFGAGMNKFKLMMVFRFQTGLLKVLDKSKLLRGPERKPPR